MCEVRPQGDRTTLKHHAMDEHSSFFSLSLWHSQRPDNSRGYRRRTSWARPGNAARQQSLAEVCMCICVLVHFLFFLEMATEGSSLQRLAGLANKSRLIETIRPDIIFFTQTNLENCRETHITSCTFPEREDVNHRKWRTQGLLNKSLIGAALTGQLLTILHWKKKSNSRTLHSFFVRHSSTNCHF